MNEKKVYSDKELIDEYQKLMNDASSHSATNAFLFSCMLYLSFVFFRGLFWIFIICCLFYIFSRIGDNPYNKEKYLKKELKSRGLWIK